MATSTWAHRLPSREVGAGGTAPSHPEITFGNHSILHAGLGVIAQKTRPRPSFRPDGEMGDGSSPLSLSRADIRRRPRGGCQLPDAILHGKRSYRPRSRAVQRLAALNFRVRLFSSLG